VARTGWGTAATAQPPATRQPTRRIAQQRSSCCQAAAVKGFRHAPYKERYLNRMGELRRTKHPSDTQRVVVPGRRCGRGAYVKPARPPQPPQVALGFIQVTSPPANDPSGFPPRGVSRLRCRTSHLPFGISCGGAPSKRCATTTTHHLMAVVVDNDRYHITVTIADRDYDLGCTPPAARPRSHGPLGPRPRPVFAVTATTACPMPSVATGPVLGPGTSSTPDDRGVDPHDA
jgi:hypothetical protein